MARNAKTIELPFQTYTRLSQARHLEAGAAFATYLEARRAFLDAALAEWTANGGCRRCLGRGWVVVWDTLDSMSGCYAEYDHCPETCCTPETRAASGLAPTYTKYDGLRGVSDPIERHPMFLSACLPLRQAAERLDASAKALEMKAVARKGHRVVVTSGRKAPVGSTWRVAFVHSNGGLLLKDESTWEDRNANGTWVNASNVEVIVDA